MKEKLKRDFRWIKGKKSKFWIIVVVFVGLFVLAEILEEMYVIRGVTDAGAFFLWTSPIPTFIILYIFDAWLYGDEETEKPEPEEK